MTTQRTPTPGAVGRRGPASTCPECRTSYVKRRFDQAFCSAGCSRKADARELKRARTLYRALYWWRYKRSGAHVADCLRFICREIADWIAEDRMHQRLPPPRPNVMVPRGHERRKAWGSPPTNQHAMEN